jgi:Fic family protein
VGLRAGQLGNTESAYQQDKSTQHSGQAAFTKRKDLTERRPISTLILRQLKAQTTTNLEIRAGTGGLFGPYCSEQVSVPWK